MKLTGVYVTEGIGFNLFSLHQAQAREITILDNEGAHLFDKQLNFPEIGSCLYATRLDPTPTAGLTALPASSGVHPPLCLLVFTPPPPPCSQSPPPFGFPSFRVDGAGPSGFGFEPLSHRNVEGDMASD